MRSKRGISVNFEIVLILILVEDSRRHAQLNASTPLSVSSLNPYSSGR